MSHCPPGCHVNFNISPFLFQQCSETNTQVQNVHSRSLRKALYNGYRRSTSCMGRDSLIRIIDCLLVTGWKSVLNQSTKHTAEIELSRHLRDCNMSDHFQNFSLAFFVDLKWNLGSSEPASSDSRTEQDVRRNARQKRKKKIRNGTPRGPFAVLEKRKHVYIYKALQFEKISMKNSHLLFSHERAVDRIN